MEDMYVNVKYMNEMQVPALTATQNESGPRNSEKRFYGVIIFSLGLLSTSLLAGLIGFGVYYHTSAAAELSIKTNLAEERDVLKSCLFEMTEKRDLLECLCRKKKTCPPGWTKFWCSCYLLSTKTGSWTTGREDCRTRGADLVVIDSIEEQTFLSTFTNMSTWIGLSDRDKEGTWKWVDGTLLTVKFWFWASNQPDNGNGVTEWGEEHCVHILGWGSSNWNDYSCEAYLLWICEKPAQF
ncbi:CD209 antigen-like protein E [Anabas testudineus]|uniref:C-type lectin domain-containing protein n=1 Tax=Anabas testudineus TaxID=64144 RepID=A0A3Q1H7C1_ANATE|nr:CD209 antigen-like protein E [Anabas testudineus]